MSHSSPIDPTGHQACVDFLDGFDRHVVSGQVPTHPAGMLNFLFWFNELPMATLTARTGITLDPVLIPAVTINQQNWSYLVIQCGLTVTLTRAVSQVIRKFNL